MADRKLNIGLLEKVREAIAKEPQTYNQNTYGFFAEDDEQPDVVEINCKTPGCIAGHALAISRTIVHIDTLLDSAQQLLGLSEIEGAYLFYFAWPESWLDDVPAPLEMKRYSDFDAHLDIEPTSEDALIVLDRLIKYGFKYTDAQEKSP